MSTPDRQAIRLQLAEIVADVLDIQTPDLADRMLSRDIPGWDSLNHLKIIVALEARFGIRFGVDEFTAPEDVGGFIDLIRSKL